MSMDSDGPQKGVWGTSQVSAYSFRSVHDLAQMELLLRARGLLSWGRGDSDDYGEYLISRPFDDTSKVRIVEMGAGEFLLDIVFRSDAPDGLETWKRLERTLLDKILPCLDPRDVEPADNLD